MTDAGPDPHRAGGRHENGHYRQAGIIGQFGKRIYLALEPDAADLPGHLPVICLVCTQDHL